MAHHPGVLLSSQPGARRGALLTVSSCDTWHLTRQHHSNTPLAATAPSGRPLLASAVCPPGPTRTGTPHPHGIRPRGTAPRSPAGRAPGAPAVGVGQRVPVNEGMSKPWDRGGSAVMWPDHGSGDSWKAGGALSRVMSIFSSLAPQVGEGICASGQGQRASRVMRFAAAPHATDLLPAPLAHPIPHTQTPTPTW